MKNFIELEFNNQPLLLAVSAIVGVAKNLNQINTCALTLNAPVQVGYNRLDAVLDLDLSYEEVLSLMEKALG